ncbi:hypothetical protein HZY91_07940 [Facklamia sp. DSM 111018]|uniref:MucBP domain-containing protein n=1 Tax=Facklamia lactis TaxID=2749967 RepID=A0ABS0LRW7_9LACT|nr:hypothetical protein [Facklamia lactis]MBG9980809.1 hypothetical protein [Facklamia lactis]MBG9986828.1 hypothetical protein [Facklamia lactis]
MRFRKMYVLLSITFCLLGVLSIEHTMINAQEVESLMEDSSEITDLNVMDESNEKRDQLQELNEELEKLENIDQYEVDIKWTNISLDQPLGEIHLLGNNKTGDLGGQGKYYFTNYFPQMAEFNFLAYQRFDLVYIQQFDLLHSLAFYKQPFFNYGFDEELAKYKDIYVQVDHHNLQINNLARIPSSSLLFLPQLDKLEMVDEESLEFDGNKYQIELERLEVPAQFFDNRSLFVMNYKLDYEINSSPSSRYGYNSWDAVMNQQLTMSEDERLMSFKVEISTDLTSQLLGLDSEEEATILPPKFEKQMNLSSTGLMDKITRVELSYDKDQQAYEILVEGMVENVEFNLFTTDTAELSTNHVRMEYQFKPTNKEIPTLDEIETMTASEASYHLEQLLEKN